MRISRANLDKDLACFITAAQKVQSQLKLTRRACLPAGLNSATRSYSQTLERPGPPPVLMKEGSTRSLSSLSSQHLTASPMQTMKKFLEREYKPSPTRFKHRQLDYENERINRHWKNIRALVNIKPLPISNVLESEKR